jgi:hypothetical protein
MALQQITGNEIAPGSIEATDLSDGSITGDKLGLTAINANNIVDATITGAKISSNTISNTAFQTGSVENYLREANLGFNLRNRIINGAMVIDQRNAGASVTPAGSANTYTLDRFAIYCSQSSKLTVQQSTTAPTGFTNSYLVTSLSAYSVISSDEFNITQAIEGFNFSDMAWGTANAKTITISFWVRSSLTGTFGGALRNASLNRNYPFSYTILTANTFEYKTITIAGDTSGTWAGATNGVAVYVGFSVGAGSSASGTAGAWDAGNIISATGATSVVGTDGATFYITGVQLEVGSTATSFDYRPYGTELALCQRYYYLHASGNSKNIGIGGYYSSTIVTTVVVFPTTMRTAPVFVQTTGTNYYKIFANNGDDDFNSFNDGIQQPTTQCAGIDVSSGVSGTAGHVGRLITNNASAFLAFDSEL